MFVTYYSATTLFDWGGLGEGSGTRALTQHTWLLTEL